MSGQRQQQQQQQQDLLSDLLATAASSKDNAGTRAGDAFHPLLTLLSTSASEPWFKPWLAEQLSSTYPRASRSLLDAVLQALIAASPLHCGHVLPSLLALPGSDTLSTPLRRDVAALFRPNPVLHSAWQQQGAVCCSMVACLATAAADAVHTWWGLQPQHQQQQRHTQEAGRKHHHCTAAAAPPAAAAQAAGTAIGWLTDCLLQAVPQHKLQLLQLALAVFVRHFSTLGQQQQQQQRQQWACDGEAAAGDPPAKRRCLEQHHGQQPIPPPSSRGCGNSSSGHSGGWQQQASPPAAAAAAVAAASLTAGLQFLAALCSCEAAQCSNSQQLLPLAAVVAAQAAAAGPEQFSTCVHSPLFRWLLLQLCSQVSASAAVPAGSTGLVGGGAGPGSAGGSPGVSSAAAPVSAAIAQLATPQQQQQQPLGAPTPLGLAPAEALQLVVGHLVSAGPTQALQVVCSLMGAPLQGGTGGAEAGAGTATAPSAAAAAPAAAAAASLATFQVLLLEAAKQWQAAPSQANSGNGAASSGRGGRGRGRAGRAGVHRATPAAAALQLEQLMPAAAPITASWACKYIAVCLCQQAAREWQQQQQQQGQEGVGAGKAGALAALLQLLTADGLLLPASGEVLVSARALAGVLCSMPAALQQQVARSWQQALLSRQLQQAGGGSATAETAAAPLLQWPTLQPMLCLLNHLGELHPAPPIAGFLGACLRSCVSAAHAAAAASGCSGIGAGGKSGDSSSSTLISEVLRHLLLPLRFKLQVHARVWLLQQLLLEGVQDGPCSSEGAVQADSPAGGLAAATEGAAVLEVLVAMLKQGPVAGQLSQGLQLLAAQRQDAAGSSREGNKAGAGSGVPPSSSASTLQSGQARDLADALVQLVSQLQQQQGGGATTAGGRLKEALLHTAGGGNGCVVELLELL